jgi:ATP-dependent DNA helicase RecQ
VVVSPLIALMKDQVDALNALGVAATCLNSSLDGSEARMRYRELGSGRCRILYVSPERLALESFLDALTGWKVARIAVDEAHCISEWGAEFRPEYRMLGALRDRFPDVPVLALTASATPRVAEDIVKHVRLREPARFHASFNRPNLFYRVEPKDDALRQILGFLKERPRDSGIIYCFSRKTTESLADNLTLRGVAAAAYHAGLDAAERARIQERFLRDDLRVVCATIAFGMGINKPNVRFVIHHDLPKNLEGYYQETGRAGRDGLPAECLLLFSGGDAAKQRHFIDDMNDAAEQQRARQMLSRMVRFAETTECRRADLLGYFGEKFVAEDCGACDNCLAPLETFDATVPAQKLLSCVVRAKRAGDTTYGLQYIVDILVGADTEKIRARGHFNLTTYGIGTELARVEWIGIGRQLLQRGLLEELVGEYPTVDVTPAGMEFLRSRSTIQLSRMRVAVSKVKVERRLREKSGTRACDEFLFEELRALRKRLADDKAVPAYIIFGDNTLREMARLYPTTPDALAEIPGVGERKLADHGPAFLRAIQDFLRTNPRQHFADR